MPPVCRRCDCSVTSRVTFRETVEVRSRRPIIRRYARATLHVSCALRVRFQRCSDSPSKPSTCPSDTGTATLSVVSNLVAEFGRVHGLLGPNGAGKTTLMRILLGLVRRDDGIVRLLGCSLDRDRRIDSRRSRWLRRYTGLLSVPVRKKQPHAARSPRRPCERRPDAQVSDCLEETGLAMHADVAVAGYSAGMRQRLGVAAALLRTPGLLFLDEPTSSLDPAGARDVRATARRLADEGAAVVLSSHDMAEVEELCETLTVLDQGPGDLCGHRGRAAKACPRPGARAPHQRQRRRTRPGRRTARRTCRIRRNNRWWPRGDGERGCAR